MDPLTTPLIHGDGTPEAAWRGWLNDQPFVQPGLAALVPAGGRLIVVAPHPDDEILACGALLAACARSGLRVLVIALTDGDASHGTHDAGAMRQLAAQRCGESARGLAVLGLAASDVRRWHLPDGQLQQHQASIATALSGVLAPDDVVLTTWAQDGHPDHEAAGAAATTACAALGCALLQAPVWMWHWAAPFDARVPWSQMVAFDAEPRDVALKQQALACHRSQLPPAAHGQLPILGEAICARAARPVEYFFRMPRHDA
jgi:LmbE family N-acetylglucosaminyl deacetylase